MNIYKYFHQLLTKNRGNSGFQEEKSVLSRLPSEQRGSGFDSAKKLFTSLHHMEVVFTYQSVSPGLTQRRSTFRTVDL